MNIRWLERVIESHTYEVAGCGKCVHHHHNPARHSFSDSAYDVLEWHDHLLAAGVVPIAPYNPRNTDDPKDIEYRVEAHINQHNEDVQLKQSVLDKQYNHQTGVERTNDATKDFGLGHVRARGRVHARTEVFLALCLRVIVAITNYERGDNPGREKLTL